MVLDNYYRSANSNFSNFKSYYKETTIAENSFGISSTSIKQVCKDCYKKRCYRKNKTI